MDKIILSKQKLKELEKERESLKDEVFEHDKSRSDEGEFAYSFKDAVVSESGIETKRKRLEEIRHIFKYTEVLPDKVNSKKAVLGSWLKVKKENGQVAKYRLVHPLEANPEKGLLSVESPLGQALLDRKDGEEFEFGGQQLKVKLID